jgi:hypothetical protein
MYQYRISEDGEENLKMLFAWHLKREEIEPISRGKGGELSLEQVA